MTKQKEKKSWNRKCLLSVLNIIIFSVIYFQPLQKFLRPIENLPDFRCLKKKVDLLKNKIECFVCVAHPFENHLKVLKYVSIRGQTGKNFKVREMFILRNEMNRKGVGKKAELEADG